MGSRAPGASQGETVTDLDTLDRRNPHERPSQAGVKPSIGVYMRSKPHGQAVDQDFYDPSYRVLSFTHCGKLRLHRRSYLRV